MKKNLLFSALFAAAITGNAQSANFNAALPADFNVNRDLMIGMYQNPSKGNRWDTGVITPAIFLQTPNAGLHVATTAAAPYLSAVSSITVQFDAFAFDDDATRLTADENEASFNCTSSLKAYIVPASYTSTTVPTGADILGESDFTDIVAGTNQLVVNVAPTLTVGTQYRLMVVGKTGACAEAQAQIYVVDDFRLAGTSMVLDFSTSFPAGWDFNRDLRITQYCNEATTTGTDVGLVTPPVSGNVFNSYLATSPATNYDPSTGTINVSFDFFAFDADTRGFGCADDRSSLACGTDVKLYLVRASYSSNSVPTGADVVAQSDWTSLVITNPNVISIPISGNLDPNTQYRIMAFGRTSGCTDDDNTQVYVVDNIRIVEIERVVLPVSFSQFTAQRNKGNVTLNWETAMEENNRGFHVQRNVDGAWKNIAFVFSKANGGNSTTALSYTFTDVNNSRGISQYRLLQVDQDNKGKLSEIRSVRGESQAAKIMVYPNPSNTGNVTVMFEDATSVRNVYVSDAAGRVVKQFRNINGNTLTIDNLNDGFYTIQIANQTTSANTVEKVIVKKR